MILTREDIQQLRLGKHSPRIVGELPDKVWRMLGLPVASVQLSRETLKHINEEHRDVSDFDLLHIPLAIGHGEVLRENKKADVIITYYVEAEQEKAYVAVMKITKDGSEIWLRSFYRMKKNEYPRLLRKAEVIYRSDLKQNRRASDKRA